MEAKKCAVRNNLERVKKFSNRKKNAHNESESVDAYTHNSTMQENWEHRKSEM